MLRAYEGSQQPMDLEHTDRWRGIIEFSNPAQTPPSISFFFFADFGFGSFTISSLQRDPSYLTLTIDAQHQSQSISLSRFSLYLYLYLNWFSLIFGNPNLKVTRCWLGPSLSVSAAFYTVFIGFGCFSLQVSPWRVENLRLTPTRRKRGEFWFCWVFLWWLFAGNMLCCWWCGSKIS